MLFVAKSKEFRDRNGVFCVKYLYTLYRQKVCFAGCLLKRKASGLVAVKVE
jgi:hypothetical protein